MSTLSVPLTQGLEEFIESFIHEGKAETKAEVARMALRKLEEDSLMNDLLIAEQEYKEGKTFAGDLRKLVKNL